MSVVKCFSGMQIPYVFFKDLGQVMAEMPNVVLRGCIGFRFSISFEVCLCHLVRSPAPYQYAIKNVSIMPDMQDVCLPTYGRARHGCDDPRS
jgi:hypothetical protein